MKRILFVCSMNLFRSPSAEILLKEILKEKKIKNIKVSSAGAGKGRPDKTDIRIVKECSEVLKINYLKRRRKILNKRMVDEAYKIIAIGDKNKKRVLRKFPESKGKLFTVNEIVGNKLNVKLRHKPVRYQVKYYKDLRKLMRKNLNKIIK